MRGANLTRVSVFCAAALTAACESSAVAPYFLTEPSSVAPSVSSSRTRWDSIADLREWVDNPWTVGPFSTQIEDDVESAHVDLRAGDAAQLTGPNLTPPFSGLRSVRMRLRYVPAPSSPTASLNFVFVNVAPTVRTDPSNPLIPSYLSKTTGAASAWQLLELLPETNRGYPAIVDARWMYLVIGRSGDIGVDFDWIELVR